MQQVFNFFRITVLIMMIMITTIGFAASNVNATIDRDKIGIDETITLTITANTVSSKQLDISGLNKDFKILGQGSASHISIANDKTYHEQSWQIVLSPKHTGTLTIPSLKIGNSYTKELSLSVSKARPQAMPKKGTELVFATAEISPQSVYVGSQTSYILKFYYATRIQQLELIPSYAPGVNIQKIDDNTTYRKTIDNVQYNVLELHYALIADKAGSYAIPGQVFSGVSLRIDKNDDLPLTTSWVPFKIATDDVQYEVKAIPAEANQKWWLPTKKLALNESWSENSLSLAVGEPITRTITLEALGVSGEQLPEITQANLQDFQVYPDKATITTANKNGNLIATRVEKIAMIPTKPGKYTLPEIQVPWWNTETNHQEIATIPAKTITIVPATITNNAENLQIADIKTVAAPTNNSKNAVKQSFSNDSIFWIFTTLILFILWAITLVAWYWYAKIKKHHPFHLAQQVSPEKISSIHRCRKNLQLACEKNNAFDAKSCLLELAKLVWPFDSFLSLEDVALKFSTPNCKRLLQNLEENLYSPIEKQWDGQALWQELKNEFSQKSAQAEKSKQILPELYLNK